MREIYSPCLRSKRKRRRRKCEEKSLFKNGVSASRVVPNGVDATTAEWEGGAFSFIHGGQWDLLLCTEEGERKKRGFYYYHSVLLSNTQ